MLTNVRISCRVYARVKVLQWPARPLTRIEARSCNRFTCAKWSCRSVNDYTCYENVRKLARGDAMHNVASTTDAHVLVVATPKDAS